MNINAWTWLTISVVFEAFADVLLKLSAVKDSKNLFLWSLAAYVATMLTWMACVYYAKAIAIPGAIWLLSGLVLTTLVGVWFGEQITWKEWSGIGLAVVAIILLCV